MNGNDHLDPLHGAPAPDATPPRRRRRALAAGLAIGLLGGTAGLVIGAPGLTSASNDLASLTEQTDTTEVPAAPSDDARPATHAERLRESLQELVDAGTITDEQADAVAEHLVAAGAQHRGGPGGEHRGGPGGEHRGGPGGQHPGRPGGGMFGRGDGATSDALTDLLGLDADELREQLRDGSTLAEIAAAQDVEPQAVIDVLVGEVEEHLDAAVENGRLEQAEADERLAEATERITERVNEGAGEKSGEQRGEQRDAGRPGRSDRPAAPNDAPKDAPKDAPDVEEN